MPARRAWKWAVILGLLVWVVLGIATQMEWVHWRGRWMYQAQTEILFNPMQPTVDRGPVPVPGFAEFVDAQCEIIQSEREINLAMQEQAWRDTGRGFTDGAIKDFKSKLIVEHTGGKVQITFLDEDRDVAVAGVKAVIDAYKKIYQETDPESTQIVLKLLSEDRRSVQNQLSALSQRETALCAGSPFFTGDSMEKYYDGKLEQLIKVEDQIDALKAQVSPPLNRPNDVGILSDPAIQQRAVSSPAERRSAAEETPPQRAVELVSASDNFRALSFLQIALRDELRDLSDRITQLRAITEQKAKLKDKEELLTKRIEQLNDQYQLSNRANFLSNGDPEGMALVEKKNGQWVKLGPEKK